MIILLIYLYLFTLTETYKPQCSEDESELCKSYDSDGNFVDESYLLNLKNDNDVTSDVCDQKHHIKEVFKKDDPARIAADFSNSQREEFYVNFGDPYIVYDPEKVNELLQFTWKDQQPYDDNERKPIVTTYQAAARLDNGCHRVAWRGTQNNEYGTLQVEMALECPKAEWCGGGITMILDGEPVGVAGKHYEKEKNQALRKNQIPDVAKIRKVDIGMVPSLVAIGHTEVQSAVISALIRKSQVAPAVLSKNANLPITNEYFESSDNGCFLRWNLKVDRSIDITNVPFIWASGQQRVHEGFGHAMNARGARFLNLDNYNIFLSCNDVELGKKCSCSPYSFCNNVPKGEMWICADDGLSCIHIPVKSTGYEVVDHFCTPTNGIYYKPIVDKKHCKKAAKVLNITFTEDNGKISDLYGCIQKNDKILWNSDSYNTLPDGYRICGKVNKDWKVPVAKQNFLTFTENPHPYVSFGACFFFFSMGIIVCACVDIKRRKDKEYFHLASDRYLMQFDRTKLDTKPKVEFRDISDDDMTMDAETKHLSVYYPRFTSMGSVYVPGDEKVGKFGEKSHTYSKLDVAKMINARITEMRATTLNADPKQIQKCKEVATQGVQRLRKFDGQGRNDLFTSSSKPNVRLTEDHEPRFTEQRPTPIKPPSAVKRNVPLFMEDREPEFTEQPSNSPIQIVQFTAQPSSRSGSKNKHKRKHDRNTLQSFASHVSSIESISRKMRERADESQNNQSTDELKEERKPKESQVDTRKEKRPKDPQDDMRKEERVPFGPTETQESRRRRRKKHSSENDQIDDLGYSENDEKKKKKHSSEKE